MGSESYHSFQNDSSVFKNALEKRAEQQGLLLFKDFRTEDGITIRRAKNNKELHFSSGFVIENDEQVYKTSLTLRSLDTNHTGYPGTIISAIDRMVKVNGVTQHVRHIVLDVITDPKMHTENYMEGKPLSPMFYDEKGKLWISQSPAPKRLRINFSALGHFSASNMPSKIDFQRTFTDIVHTLSSGLDLSHPKLIGLPTLLPSPETDQE